MIYSILLLLASLAFVYYLKGKTRKGFKKLLLITFIASTAYFTKQIVTYLFNLDPAYYENFVLLLFIGVIIKEILSDDYIMMGGPEGPSWEHEIERLKQSYVLFMDRFRGPGDVNINNPDLGSTDKVWERQRMQGYTLASMNNKEWVDANIPLDTSSYRGLADSIAERIRFACDYKRERNLPLDVTLGDIHITDRYTKEFGMINSAARTYPYVTEKNNFSTYINSPSNWSNATIWKDYNRPSRLSFGGGDNMVNHIRNYTG